MKAIQKEYFEILNSFLSKNDLDEFKNRSDNLSAFRNYIHNRFQDQSFMMPYRGKLIPSFEYRFYQLLKEISAFWDRNKEAVLKELRENDSYRIVAPVESFYTTIYEDVKALSIYFDTVVFPDPLHFERERLEEWIDYRPEGKVAGEKYVIFENLIGLYSLMELRDKKGGQIYS